MRLYKGKDNAVIPRMSQQEAIEVQLSQVQFIPIYRADQQIGHFDRATNTVRWNAGVEFTDDVEYVSLFKPEQKESI